MVAPSAEAFEQLAKGPGPTISLLVRAGLDVIEEPAQRPLGVGAGSSHRDRLLAVPAADRVPAERDAQLVDLAGDLGSDASSHVSSRRFWDRSGTRGTRTSFKSRLVPLTWRFRVGAAGLEPATSAL